MLKEKNRFERKGTFYIHDQSPSVFAYSDGDDIEKYMKSVLEKAQDLSSHSVELESAIQDWATEYHLSSKRANLLRAFDLTDCKNVLELGCGCGAITRYLGEQGGTVEAIEGSATRAELTSLRCRDLHNVSVFCGNFNAIDLPEGHYDLICLVGVTEYAARFMDAVEESKEPVVILLERLKAALKPDGVLLIAIENRTGMKYVFGAHEDHYSRKYVGINNYFGQKDINTYALPEWERMFDQLGVTDREIYLPFPDYKIPTVVLAQNFVRNDPNAFCSLEGVESRDYVELFKPTVSESLFWQAAAGSGSMDAFANSFLFALSVDGGTLKPQYHFDFAHLPSFSRKREYCLITVKPAGQDQVKRTRLVEGELSNGVVDQRVIEEPYRKGALLSLLWSRAVELEPDGERFLSLVKEYFAYVKERDNPSIDLIPSNIVVGENGEYHPFDEEWITRETVSPEYLVFRSLLVLLLKSENSIQPYARKEKLQTKRDFIVHVGTKTGLDLAGCLEKHMETEERFQSSIAVKREGNPTQSFLETSIIEARSEVMPIKARLYWRGKGVPYTEDRCRYVDVENGDEIQSIAFKLPPAARKAHQFRFNPCELQQGDERGFMRFHRVEAFVIDGATGGKKTSVWKMSTPDDIARYSKMSDMRYVCTGLGWVFMATNEEPWLEFEFIPRKRPAGDQYLEFQVEMSLPRSSEYRLARDRFLMTEEWLEEKLRHTEDVYETYLWTKHELEGIKNANFWKYVQKYVEVRHTVDNAFGKVAFWAGLVKRLGVGRTLGRARRQIRKRITGPGHTGNAPAGPPTRYEVWRDRCLDRKVEKVSGGPLISVVMPVFNVDEEVLRKAVQSVRDQAYKNWELCIVDDASTRPETGRALEEIGGSRIKIRRLPERRNISGATNVAVELARGDYLAFMDNDDELPDDALSEIAAVAVRENADVVYTDEDFIKVNGHLDYPHFKPDYSPDLLLSHNYITHLLAIKKELFNEVGGLRTEYDGAQDYDLVLRAVEKAQKIVHIPKPLYHWRMSKTSTSVNPAIKPGGHDNARKALEAALARRGIDGTVEETGLPHYFRVRRRISGNPLVSIVIPFKDKREMLRKCVNSLLETTSYARFEILGISNDSRISATYDEMRKLGELDDRISFHELNIRFNFSKLVNHGVELAKGEHVVLLNNDIEFITPDWIEGLLEHSQRPEIAAVGAKLYYPNNTIQHAGIAVGLGGYAGHPHRRFRADSAGYFNRLNVTQNVSAVTGAFMMVEKSKYLDIGKFDEDLFGVAYNDVDFCLRALENGYLNVFTPYVEAYHHESISRGYEDTAEKQQRFDKEKHNLRERHGPAIERGDPYYSPNFDRNRDDFRLPTFLQPNKSANPVDPCGPSQAMKNSSDSLAANRRSVHGR